MCKFPGVQDEITTYEVHSTSNGVHITTNGVHSTTYRSHITTNGVHSPARDRVLVLQGRGGRSAAGRHSGVEPRYASGHPILNA